MEALGGPRPKGDALHSYLPVPQVASNCTESSAGKWQNSLKLEFKQHVPAKVLPFPD